MNFTQKLSDQTRIAVIGLGYVGLPLAVALARRYPVVGFDINEARIKELQDGQDHTLEVAPDELKEVLHHNIMDHQKGLFVTSAIGSMSECTVYIVTVPTPTDKHNRPVLTPLQKASETVGRVLRPGDLVIYESTVYPGVTEDECVPILAQASGLSFNRDFFAGYSPERINPGDKEHTVTKIKKVTSGSTPEAAQFTDALYASVITAGTKWNFTKFQPGLVGGHCIGVDPYYLAQKAQEAGYHPENILAGRRLNASMGRYVAQETIKLMMRKDLRVIDAKVLLLGFTFKEDCPDVRNTRVIDIYQELRAFDVDVEVWDPWANASEVRHEYGIDIHSGPTPPALDNYSALILAVAHRAFQGLPLESNAKRVVYDVKGLLPRESTDGRL